MGLKIFGWSFLKGRQKKDREDLLEISRVIGPLIDKAANDILVSYSKQLLVEPITYIVPAVWNAKKDGELTACQREIHKKIGPVIEHVIQTLGIRGLSGAQEFAIGYLIRGYLISKITYMIENLRGQIYRRGYSSNGKEDILNRMGTWGNA